MDQKQVDNHLALFEKEIKAINNRKAIFDAKNIFYKSLFFTDLIAKLKDKNTPNKKELGIFINEIKNKIEKIVNDHLAFLKREEISKLASKYDVELEVDYLQSNFINPVDLIKNQIITFFKKANFKISTLSEISSTDLNFDFLGIPKDHPARSESDTFYFDDKTLLKVHNTSITMANLLKFNELEEIKVLSYGNVYRNDDDDPTHSHQFNQIDMVWAKKDLSLANLKWLTQQLMNYLFQKELSIRYRLSYFPFTEPSFEIDISCLFCNQNKCNICKYTGWIEIMGAGLLTETVLKNAGLKHNLNAIAFGMGIDRIAMLKYQISDIRDIYKNDFSLIKQFRGKL